MTPSTTFGRSRAGAALFFAMIAVSPSLSTPAKSAEPIAAQAADKHPRFLVHLLDYLAKDYGGAVERGKVVSESEYREQVEFCDTAMDTARKIEAIQKTPSLHRELTALSKLIHRKGEADEVAKIARGIQSQVIQITKLEIAPSRWPSLKNGKQIFSQNCASCHGATGAGDGLSGVNLDPKPANFRDEHMKELAPFQAFNTIRLGVPGTGMAAYHHLSDKEIWDLAFYVVALRYDAFGPSLTTAASRIENVSWLKWDDANLKKIATSSDLVLEKYLENKDEADRAAVLATIRNHSDDDPTGGGSLDIASNQLDEALKDYQSGQPDSAKTKALKAYLEGVEPVEPRLRASDPSLVSNLEDKMARVRSAIESRSALPILQQSVDTAKNVLKEAQALLSSGSLSPWVAFMGASAIILREGFEAVLLIIALLSVIRASGSRRAATWVHGGWITAIGLGAVAWVFSGWLLNISGAQREMMEGVVSLFAVVVLLVVGFWLHSQTEIGRWQSFIHGKVQKALGGRNLYGLASISFLAVFREAFETVLFLRAIWLEGGESSKLAMASGVGISLIAVIAMAWAVLKFSARLPIRKLFMASAVMMAALALILTGKGFHALQETGALSVSNPPLAIHSDLLGLYPTWETLLAQVVILAAVVGLWVWGKRPSNARAS